MNRSIALAASALLIPAAHADPIDGTGWSLVFSDDFDGTAVDESRWTYHTDAKSWSAQRPDDASIADGVMSVALRHEDYNGKHYTGGGLVTRQRFREGYYETGRGSTTAPAGIRRSGSRRATAAPPTRTTSAPRSTFSRSSPPRRPRCATT